MTRQKKLVKAHVEDLNVIYEKYLISIGGLQSNVNPEDIYYPSPSFPMHWNEWYTPNSNSPIKTTEIINVDGSKSNGPDLHLEIMDHCMVTLPDGIIMIIGLYSCYTHARLSLPQACFYT